MASRSWFYASEGQQQGPYPEIQLRELLARGTITADTLVWTDGMANWQKAREIPGLAPGAMAMQRSGDRLTSAGGYGGGPLSIDFGIWDFVWRGIVLLIGFVLVIPVPWVMVWYIRWIVRCVHVPGRPSLSFTGAPLTVASWYFGFVVLLIIITMTDVQWLNLPLAISSIALHWLFFRWFVENLASDMQPLGLTFSGSFWAYLGWIVLASVSFITIIGWAWVYAAMTRWFCRNIQGTRREIVFIGTGLEILWRSIVAALASSLIIPVPWVYRWMMRWMASQTRLVERSAMASM